MQTLDFPMSFTKPNVQFIPSSMPNDRHCMLKSRSRLEEVDDTSSDIFEKGYIDRYPIRPDNLSNICYKEFAANYKLLDTKITDSNMDRVIVLKDDKSTKMIKRESPQIIRSHTPSRKNDPEKYYYSKLCLYLPWTSDEELLGNHSSYEESFLANINIVKENMKKFEFMDMGELESIVEEITANILQNHVEDDLSQDLDDRGLMSYPTKKFKAPEDVPEDNYKFVY